MTQRTSRLPLSEELTRRRLLASTFGAIALAALQACGSSPTTGGATTISGGTIGRGTIAGTGSGPATTALNLPPTSLAQLAKSTPRLFPTRLFETIATRQGKSVLGANGPVTILAPSPKALELALDDLLARGALPLSTDKLLTLAKGHVIPGVRTVADLASNSGASLTTVGGQTITVGGTAAAPTVGGARIEEADLAFEGGVVHVIDQAILPPEVQEPTPQPPPPSGLADAIAEVPDAGLVAVAFTVPALSGMIAMPDATLFAPVDEAILATLLELEEADELPEEMQDLIRTATRHIALGTFTAEDLAQMDGRQLQTIDGGTLSVEVADGVIRVDGAQVLASVPVIDGALHLIDLVILPEL
jgi:transforming growth factor-beta-induced protein